MSLMADELQYRKLRAPQGDGQTLVDPPAAQFSELLSRNVAAIGQYDLDLQGRSLQQLIRQGREELLAAAVAATTQYRDVDTTLKLSAETPILLAGHQPELFHPGVWYKNFVLSRLAAGHSAVAVNLVIDSDVIKDAAIRVPTGTIADPRVEHVAFDQATVEMPLEERRISDRDCWETFGRRAANEVQSLAPSPLIEEFWPRAIARSRHTDRLGECLAQARHQQEGEWGATTLEIPQSQVCQLPAFYGFAAHLLAHLPRLWDIYNSSVGEYRRVNHVRSSAHPVPDLAASEDWLEAPFWIWSAASPRRGRLFVRQSGEELLLSNRAEIEVRVPLSPEGDARKAVSALDELSRRGIKLRTRALVTTMFARLVLGDVFLHGIGGAKYDQLTDVLIRRFFGLDPPGYLTVTATLRLPIELPAEAPEQLQALDAQLRSLSYHPETWFNGASISAEASRAIESKRRWVGALQTIDNAKTRCRAIRSANEALQPLLAPERERLLKDRQRAVDALRRRSLLGSREYSFVLYPAEQLRALFDSPLA
jgi:hypothetical protein